MSRHVPALDGIRGAAVLLVLAHDFDLLDGVPGAPAKAIGLAMDVGWIGVQLFFVLSGYLITGILLDTREAPNYWSAFLGRRAVRIFPLYYAVLFVAFVVAPLAGHTPAGAQHQLWLWTYLANWAEPLGRTVSVFPHFWSLSIEEQFYLAWPLLVRKLRPRALGMLCLGLVALAFASRLALRASGWSGAASGAYVFTVCRVDALALGALAALAVRAPRLASLLSARLGLLRGVAIALPVATVLVTRGAPRAGLLTQSYGYTLFAVAFAALILDLALAPAGDRFRGAWSFAPLRAVGRYSYAMYVFHTPLHLLVGLPLLAALGASRPGLGLALGYFVAATAVTFVAALASHHAFERHFLALKERMVPRVPA
jgi:peptidoglycan/LPS O-acetylase OafA/YrhL